MTMSIVRETISRLEPGWQDTVTLVQSETGFVHTTFFAQSDSRNCVVKLIDPTMLNAVIPCGLGNLLENTRLAGNAGIGAGVIATYEDSAVLVLEFLEGKTLESSDLHDLDRLSAAVHTVKRLHECTNRPTNVFDLGGRFAYWEPRVLSAHPRWGEQATKLAGPLQDILAALASRQAEMVFTHNDLLAANFIATDSGIRVIDYDYAGLGDPAFDLGTLIAESDLPEAAQERIASEYFGRSDDRDLAVLKLGRIAADLVCGALIAYAVTNFPAKFAEIADELGVEIDRKFSAAWSGIETSDFARNLKLAAAQQQLVVQRDTGRSK